MTDTKQLIQQRIQEVIDERKDRKSKFVAWATDMAAMFDKTPVAHGFLHLFEYKGETYLGFGRLPQIAGCEGDPHSLFCTLSKFDFFENEQQHHVGVPFAFMHAGEARSRTFTVNDLPLLTERLIAAAADAALMQERRDRDREALQSV
jgi:hypothetical protein